MNLREGFDYFEQHHRPPTAPCRPGWTLRIHGRM